MKGGLKELGGPNIPGFAIGVGAVIAIIAGCMLFAFDGIGGTKVFV